MTDIKQHQIVINNLLINYYSSESTSGTQSVIFLHGWRSEGNVWFNAMHSLNGPSYALDLPGFGKSDMPSSASTLEDYANIVAAFIRKLELKEVIVVGHSFGGRIAIKLASSPPGSDNNVIRKLVLVDAAGFHNEGVDIKLKKSIAHKVKPLFKLPGLKQLRPHIYKVMGAQDYTATPQLRETFVNIINEDLSSYLKQIFQPTMLVWGELDEDTPVDFAHKMRENIPNSQMMMIKDAGHFSFLDQSDQFCEALNKFITA